MRLILTSIVILGFISFGFSQGEDSNIKKNNISGEVYFFREINAFYFQGFASLNFERNFNKDNNWKIGVYPNTDTGISFPLTFTEQYELPWRDKLDGNHYIESGIGIVASIDQNFFINGGYAF